MCFQSRFLGSFHSLLPNAPENNPTVFFPGFSGNDLTARKRNAKHSLELCVTSARRGGPCSSARLDIPEQSQHKFPTAGVNCCFSAAPQRSRKKEGWLLTSGPLLFTGNAGCFMCYDSKLENAIIDGKKCAFCCFVRLLDHLLCIIRVAFCHANISCIV